MKIIDLTPENIADYGVCGYKDVKKHVELRRKIEWFKKYYPKGLRIKAVLSDDGSYQGMIEYIPGEHAHRPVEADGYLFIHCIFVGFTKEYKGRGYGVALVESCLSDALEANMKGVVVVTRKGSFMAGDAIFSKLGFEVADKVEPDFHLMVKKFDSGAESPRFRTDMKEHLDLYSEGLTILRSPQCPYTEKNVNAIVASAREQFGIEARIVDLEDEASAKQSPCPFGTFCIIYNGEIISHHPISNTRFLNIMAKVAIPVQKYAKLDNEIVSPYLEQGDASGDVLIMLHGIADSCRIFEPMLPYIPKSIHVYAVTLRGHGDASRPETGYGTDDFVEDLRLFMDGQQIDKAFVLGASSGGFPARRFAINYPDRVSGLILLGSPSSLQDNPFAKDLWDTVISKLTDPIDPEFIRRFAQNLTSKKIPEGVMNTMLRENQKVPARVWIGTTEGIMQEAFPGDLGKISAKTLLLWGEEDTVVSREDKENLAKAIKHSRIAVRSGVGHLLYLEDPDRVASEITAFIQE